MAQMFRGWRSLCAQKLFLLAMFLAHCRQGYSTNNSILPLTIACFLYCILPSSSPALSFFAFSHCLSPLSCFLSVRPYHYSSVLHHTMYLVPFSLNLSLSVGTSFSLSPCLSSFPLLSLYAPSTLLSFLPSGLVAKRITCVS